MSKIIELEKRKKEIMGILKPLAEKPRLDDHELSQWKKYADEVERVSSELSRLYQAREARYLENARSFPDKDLARFSLRRAIHLKAQEKPLDGIEAEIIREGEKELKELGLFKLVQNDRSMYIPAILNYKPIARASTGQNVTTAGDGGNLVQDGPLLFLEGLRNAMVLPAMGANFLTGLVGNFPISLGGTFSSEWLLEDGASTATKMSFGKKYLKPKRLQTTGVLTRQLLSQSSPAVDAIVEKDIIKAIAEALQAAAINGAGVDPYPTGILQTDGIGEVIGGTNGAAPTLAKMIELESRVADANALLNPMLASYLTNSSVRGKLKSTFKNGTYGEVPIWERGALPGIGEVNGYSAYTTNSVPSNLSKGSASGVCSAMIFGVWDQLFIGQWGGYELIVDPYTLSDKGEVKTTIIQHADAGVGHPQSFAAMVDILTDSDS